MWVCFCFYLWANVWVASCLDPLVYQKCFGIWCSSGLFCHMIGMWSPWQRRRLYQVHGILCNSHMCVGSGGLMSFVAAIVGKTEVISSVCLQYWQFWIWGPYHQGCLLLWPWGQGWAISWLAHCLWGHRLHRIGHFVPLPHLLGSYIYQQGPSDDLPVHLGSLHAWFAHLQIGIFSIIETQYGPSEMLNDPGRVSHSFWYLQYHLWSHQQVSTSYISGSGTKEN